MLRRILLFVVCALPLSCWGADPVAAQQTEPRIALVVGNAGYGPGALPTALNDAGLVAEALRSVGFEIVEGANLSQPDLVRTFRDFLAKVDASGPDTLAFVYFSGHALAFEGDNFLLGVDARLERESDIPIEAVRLSDLLRPLADSPARAKVVMIDAARPLPFRPQGRGLARGLEAIEAPKGMLVAFSSAPGTVAPDRPGNYGAYATAIAEMLRAPGTDLEAAFTHIRSRTHLSTQGQQTPWHVSALGEPIELVPPEAATASLPPPPPPRAPRPMREINPDEAYALAIEMDSLDGYVGFVEAYPRSPYSDRVWAMIRARREAMAWMRALQFNTPQAYWTYLRRYPDGMYAFDAERRLGRLRAPFAAPPGFAMMEFDDVPMALLDEPREYREVYRVGPPPPRLLFRPPPAFFVSLPPPRRGVGPRALPLMSAAIPVIPRLAPAPRRGPPGASFAPGGRPDFRRPGGVGGPPAGAPPGGSFGRTPGVAPSTVAPSGVAPSTVAPTAIAPGTVTPSPGGAPPTGRRGPPGGPPPAGTAIRTPGVAPSGVAPSTVAPTAIAPSTVTPSPGGAPPTGRRGPPGGPPPAGTATRTPGSTPSTTTPAPGGPPPRSGVSPGSGRPPGGGPPAGSVSRTPGTAPAPGAGSPRSGPPPRPPVTGRPSGPPPTASRAPTVAPAAKPAPVVRPAPPPRVAAPPPPQRPAAAPAKPAAKPPACPAGKTFKDGACR